MPNKETPVDTAAFERFFPPLNGPLYYELLQAIHHRMRPEWYLEIGSASGRSLQLAPGRAFAVDPNFGFQVDPQGSKPELHCYRMESDAFFAAGHVEKIAGKIEFAFLDGLHHFDQLLRDFINAERVSRPDTVIAIHDVIPITPIAAEREWDRERTVQWTGDVWKVVPILRKWRPELDLTVVDTPPSGLALVTGLDPTSTVLSDHYVEITQTFLTLKVADFGIDKLARELAIVDAYDPALTRFFGKLAPSSARPAQ